VLCAVLVSVVLPFVVVEGWWSISGPCSTAPEDSDCIITPGFPNSAYGNDQTCTMHWYGNGQWYLAEEYFETESCCDHLNVNGHDYSGNQGSITADRPNLISDVTWRSDGSVTYLGWKLCARPWIWRVSGPCTVVTSEPQCVTSPYWPLNYGDSQSCTMSIADGRQMYLQVATFHTEENYDKLTFNGIAWYGDGRNLVSFSSPLYGSVTWESDSSNTDLGWKICAREGTDVYWNVAGPCRAAPGEPHCVTSPNWPSNYENDQSCTMVMPNRGQMYLQAPSFLTETGNFDPLTINGNMYSGNGDGLAGGGVVPFSGEVTWISDGSNTYPGWKICAYSSPNSITFAAGELAERVPAAAPNVTVFNKTKTLTKDFRDGETDQADVGITSTTLTSTQTGTMLL